MIEYSNCRPIRGLMCDMYRSQCARRERREMQSRTPCSALFSIARQKYCLGYIFPCICYCNYQPGGIKAVRENQLLPLSLTRCGGSCRGRRQPYDCRLKMCTHITCAMDSKTEGPLCWPVVVRWRSALYIMSIICAIPSADYDNYVHL